MSDALGRSRERCDEARDTGPEPAWTGVERDILAMKRFGQCDLKFID
jgi:hypothetical protein